MTGRQTFDPETGERSNGRPRPRRRTKLPDRYEMLVDGRLTVDDLDDEELMRGKLRNSRGTFAGQAPRAIPWSLHKAAMDSIGKRMERRLAGSIEDILDNLAVIASGGDGVTRIPADAQVKAAVYLADRVLGKTADRQEITATVTARWEQAVGDGTLFVDIDPDPSASSPADGADIVDAELVEDRPALRSTIEPEVEPVVADVAAERSDRAPAAEPQDPTPAARPARIRPQRKSTGIKL